MAALRIVSSNALRAAARCTPARLTGASALTSTSGRRALSATPRAASTEGYGDDGPRQPAASDPQRQPAASAAQTTREHPGPDPPDAGKGTGAGPTKGAMYASMKQAADREGGGGGGGRSSKKNNKKTAGGDVANASSGGGGGGGGSPGGEALKGPQGRHAPKPKIHNQNVPGPSPGLSGEQKREVEQHNREFDKRHDRAAAAGEDKVDKKFWQGT